MPSPIVQVAARWIRGPWASCTLTRPLCPSTLAVMLLLRSTSTWLPRLATDTTLDSKLLTHSCTGTGDNSKPGKREKGSSVV